MQDERISSNKLWLMRRMLIQIDLVVTFSRKSWRMVYLALIGRHYRVDNASSTRVSRDQSGRKFIEHLCWLIVNSVVDSNTKYIDI